MINPLEVPSLSEFLAIAWNVFVGFFGASFSYPYWIIWVVLSLIAFGIMGWSILKRFAEKVDSDGL